MRSFCAQLIEDHSSGLVKRQANPLLIEIKPPLQTSIRTRASHSVRSTATGRQPATEILAKGNNSCNDQIIFR